MQNLIAQAVPIVGIGGAAVWAVALIIYDVRQRRLPDFLTLPAAALALGWIGFTLQWHALWGLLWSALYLLLALASNGQRSEEHTSELQSRGHLVCRLLLEKKNNRTPNNTTRLP